MPILKFFCNDCGKEFPKIIVSPDQIPRKCTVCGSENVEHRGNAFEVTQESLSRFSCDSCDSCAESCS